MLFVEVKLGVQSYSHIICQIQILLRKQKKKKKNSNIENCDSVFAQVPKETKFLINWLINWRTIVLKKFYSYLKC